MLFSYGSGLTATMFSLLLREGQDPFSLANIATVMNVGEKLKKRHEVFSSFFPLETIISDLLARHVLLSVLASINMSNCLCKSLDNLFEVQKNSDG